MKSELIRRMAQTNLFQKHLLPDIRLGIVIPAERATSFDFYYKGGNLFKFNSDGEFQTHVKYASVVRCHNVRNDDYVTEKEFETAKRIKDFRDGYDRIKENCALHAGVERSGVYHIHRRSSFIRSGSCVVLDIEIALSRKDFVDLLIFDKDERSLHFFEAKHFSNSELWSSAGTKPPVVNQIGRYNARLREKEEWVINRYRERVLHARELFGIEAADLPLPERLDKETVLFLFGYDAIQFSRIRKLLIDDGSLKGLRFRSKGHIEDRAFNGNALMKRIRRL